MQNLTLQLQTKPAETVKLPGKGRQKLTRYKKELIKIGDYIKASTDMTFSVTADTLKHWDTTFHEWIGNGLKVPIPLGHSGADNPEKNRGWVEDMFIEGDSLFGILKLSDPDLALTTDVSIFCPIKYTDGKGNTYNQPIAHVALCTDPVIPGLEGFEQLSLSLGEQKMSLEDKVLDEEKAVAKVEEPVAVELSQVAGPQIVKLVSENRAIKIANLVTAGVITPAIKTAIYDKLIAPEVLSLSLSNEHDDGFDFLVQILTENKTVSLGEKTTAQSLELSNTRSQVEANPIKDDIDRRVEASK